jgi:hypothetical protein
VTAGAAPAVARWAQALASWAIPEEILAQAPVSPWGHPPARFADLARDALSGPATPTHLRVAEALPPGGTLLDVGAGSGAASLPVHPARLVAVDASEGMLQELVRLAAAGTAVEPVLGRWPEVAPQVGQADVVVCAHVAYDVPALDAFVTALSAAARERVVLELTAVHPQASLSWLWQRFWGVQRPTSPTAQDALDVVRETLGVDVASQAWERPRHVGHASDPETVAWVRRRLCLAQDADAQLATLLAQPGHDEPVTVVTAWWDPGQS